MKHPVVVVWIIGIVLGVISASVAVWAPGAPNAVMFLARFYIIHPFLTGEVDPFLASEVVQYPFGAMGWRVAAFVAWYFGHIFYFSLVLSPVALLWSRSRWAAVASLCTLVVLHCVAAGLVLHGRPRDREIAWDIACNMVKAGLIGSAEQGHSLDIGLTTVYGARYSTTEPQIDDIIRVLRDAPNRKVISFAKE